MFPEVPINAGTFEPLKVTDPEGTFLYAKYPRPVSGCAAEVSQRIAEAVFDALVKAIPDQLFAAPAGSSGNLAVGGHDPKRDRSYVMYVISGGGYGGNATGDGISTPRNRTPESRNVKSKQENGLSSVMRIRSPSRSARADTIVLTAK